MHYNHQQLEKIFSIGDQSLQVLPTYGLANYSDVAQAIDTNPIDTLRDFLDYQLQHTSYPSLLYQQLNYALECKSSIDRTKQEIVYTWLSEKTNLNTRMLKVAQKHFSESSNYRPQQLESWEKKVKDATAYEEEDDIRHFLAFGLALLNEGLEIHQLVCNNPDGCNIDLCSTRRIKITESIIEQLTASSDPQIPHKRIQWLGNQKQLAELFIELQKKGWIGKFEYNAIRSCFTQTDHINQPLKPLQDKKTKEKTFGLVYTPHYSPVFFGIKDNPTPS